MKTIRTWRPSGDTGVAALSALAMIALYWTTTQVLGSGWSVILVFGLLTNLGLNLLFPLWLRSCPGSRPATSCAWHAQRQSS